ncbi:MAG: hypothetical protein J6A01_06665, partial [Proteobacteria bacterium]|nr:hypothetical protein [Pseudomonadota bacterium]
SSKNSRLMIYVGTDRKKSGHVYEIWGVNQIYWHPNYVDANKSGNDIALIKLKNKMTREDVTPILPHPKWLMFNDYKMPVNMKLVGFGYDHNGVAEIKNQKFMPITFYCGAGNPTNSVNGCPLANEVHVTGCHPNPYYCESRGYVDYYAKITMSYGSLYHSIDAGGECNGDSGGPSLYTLGGVQYVSGITSWGDPVCHGFNISTAVCDYYDWITTIAPEVASQYKEICDNGIDDDGNGKIDGQDPACLFCGNGIVNVGETCDGTHFSGDRKTCAEWDSMLYSGGNVSCNKDCSVNFDNCVRYDYCGDGKLKDNEECDGSVFLNGMKTCIDFDSGYTSGDLKCTSRCEIDISDCRADAKCGDSVVEGDENCDGSKFYKNLTSCNSIFPELYESGKVQCTNKCKYDTRNCVAWCGNGSLNKKVGEVCDGDKFGGETCETLVGLGSKGTLKCVSGCTQIDTSDCSKPLSCGNGIINEGEKCDGNAFPGGKNKCYDYDHIYAKGVLSCNANCTINDSMCEVGTCGNGVLDEGEVCDGTKYINKQYSCKTLFPDLYSSGQVTCNDNCEYDTSACVSLCGNGSVNVSKGEVCDHGATDKFTSSTNTCEKVVGAGSTGTLICADDCLSIITAGCSEPAFCGDHIVNNAEQCDGPAFPGNRTTCAAWDSMYASGNLKCNTNCTLDLSDCTLLNSCGDNIVNGTELCDTTSFLENRTLCSAWDSQYASGRVSCTSSCELDYSKCSKDPTITDEICDNLVDDDDNGLIDCYDSACATDEICKAEAECGNGIVDGYEQCDGTSFLSGKTQCNDWMKVFKSGTVTCHPNCTINYETCSTSGTEICDNQIDDNGDGHIDCDDEECTHSESCSGTVPPANAHYSDSDCNSAPLSPVNTPLAVFLGMLGLGALIKRRKQNS